MNSLVLHAAEETSDDDYSDVPPDDADPLSPALRATLAYNFKHHRYREEDRAIRDLLSSHIASCPDADCPTRGLTGCGARACKHTFPCEFRPPAELKSCAHCGTPSIVLAVSLFVQVVILLTS